MTDFPWQEDRCAQDLDQREQSAQKRPCVAVWDADGGYIIPGNSNLPLRILHIVQREISNEAGVVRLYQEKGIYVGCTQIKNERMPSRHRNQELCAMCARASLGGNGHSPLE